MSKNMNMSPIKIDNNSSDANYLKQEQIKMGTTADLSKGIKKMNMLNQSLEDGSQKNFKVLKGP